jgi:chloramphenicol-sensitive protein RarD
LGAAPWIALILSSTMSVYGLLKKTIAAGPITTVTVEALLLSPLALIWLYGAHLEGWTAFVEKPGGWFGASWADTALLIASGPLTGGPLLLFAAAAQRLRYATLGLLQYLNPTLQFFCAVVVFGEAFTLWHGVAFAMIWTAIAIYSAAGRSSRRVVKGPESPLMRK